MLNISNYQDIIVRAGIGFDPCENDKMIAIEVVNHLSNEAEQKNFKASIGPGGEVILCKNQSVSLICFRGGIAITSNNQTPLTSEFDKEFLELINIAESTSKNFFSSKKKVWGGIQFIFSVKCAIEIQEKVFKKLLSPLLFEEPIMNNIKSDFSKSIAFTSEIQDTYVSKFSLTVHKEDLKFSFDIGDCKSCSLEKTYELAESISYLGKASEVIKRLCKDCNVNCVF